MIVYAHIMHGTIDQPHPCIKFCLDFGVGRKVSKIESVATTQCGTRNYAAPEVFTFYQGAYDGKKADVWSM